jgi:hypothetical protein
MISGSLGEGETYVTRRGVSVNKLGGTVNNEISHWTDMKIQRMSHGVHFFVIDT